MTALLEPTSVWVYRGMTMHRPKPAFVARCNLKHIVDGRPHATVPHGPRRACQPHLSRTRQRMAVTPKHRLSKQRHCKAATPTLPGIRQWFTTGLYPRSHSAAPVCCWGRGPAWRVEMCRAPSPHLRIWQICPRAFMPTCQPPWSERCHGC